MAVGSNTLGLIFKIGVDAGDAKTGLAGLVTALKEGLGQGAVQGVKDFEKAATGAFDRIGNSLSQTRSGLQNLFSGDIISGTTQLVKQFGVLAVGLGAIAAAGLAAKKTIEGILDVAEKVGTDSKEDFEEFQKSIARVGGQVTLLDHALGQELLKSAGDVKAAFDNMFVKMLEKEGPALILLFQEIVKFINGPLTTASDNWVHRQVEGIIQFIALGRALDAYFNLPSNLRTFDMFQKITPAYIEQVRRELEGLTSSFQGATGTFDDTGTTKDHTKALKDLTQAQLEENTAARELALERAKAATQEAEINRLLKAGAITAEEALARRLAIQQNIRNAEDALLDAQRKRIDEDVKGENRKTDALAENENKRKILAEQGAKDQAAINAQEDADQTKITENRLKQLDKIIEKEKDLDAIIRERAKAAPPGAPLAVEGQVPGLPAEIPLPKPPSGLFQEIGDALKDSGAAFDTWGKFASEAISGVANATQNLLANFILTGKGGVQAFKSLAAGIIASLAVEAGTRAIMEVAYGIADTAKGTAAATNPFTAWMAPGYFAAAAQHFASATTFGIVAGGAAAVGIGIGLAGGLGGGGGGGAGAAGGSGGFGGTPGEVTINERGAGGHLGILLSINDHLSNLSTATPGDVVTRGSEQNPVAIGQANNEASRRDGSISREFLQISGLRTA